MSNGWVVPNPQAASGVSMARSVKSVCISMRRLLRPTRSRPTSPGRESGMHRRSLRDAIYELPCTGNTQYSISPYPASSIERSRIHAPTPVYSELRLSPAPRPAHPKTLTRPADIATELRPCVVPSRASGGRTTGASAPGPPARHDRNRPGAGELRTGPIPADRRRARLSASVRTITTRGRTPRRAIAKAPHSSPGPRSRALRPGRPAFHTSLTSSAGPSTEGSVD